MHLVAGVTAALLASRPCAGALLPLRARCTTEPAADAPPPAAAPPQDFTFVCPTEIIAFSDRAKEFEALNCQLIAASTDTPEVHLAWIKTARSRGGLGFMQIPIVADVTKVRGAQRGVCLVRVRAGVGGCRRGYQSWSSSPLTRTQQSRQSWHTCKCAPRRRLAALHCPAGQSAGAEGWQGVARPVRGVLRHTQRGSRAPAGCRRWRLGMAC